MSSIFTEKTVQPDDKLLAETIGESYAFWQEIRKFIEHNHGATTEEWKYYGQKYGWTLKKFLKKRNLFFLNPARDFFNIAFVFGDRAVDAIIQSDLPAEIISEIKDARKYAEGRGINIEVRSSADVAVIKKLIDIKINN